MAKRKYVDDNYVQEVENYIYNDIPVLKHPYYEDAGKKVNSNFVEGILKPGEKYVYLRDNVHHMVVTSFGRIINAETSNQLKLRVYKGSCRMIVKGTQIKLKEIFEENAWNYDWEEIKKVYSKYKWPYSYVYPE